MTTTPILLDTDIGSDIDDAVALAYLLKQPQCDLLGITTVSGEPDKRAALASAVCHAAGRPDVPVHVGVEAPFLGDQWQPKASQAEALTSDWPHKTYGMENTAIGFLRDTIRARPGEITLLTIGPLTNIALLFALDPELPGLLKELMMMGGWFFHPDFAVEWNIKCDPYAAARVFASPVPKLTAVGIDVTGQCKLPADECRTRFAKAGGPLGVVAAMAEVWFRHVPEITFHDPLAAALIFQPDLCQTVNSQITVDLTKGDPKGQTVSAPDAKGSVHHIAKTVNAAAFFDHYFGIVGG